MMSLEGANEQEQDSNPAGESVESGVCGEGGRTGNGLQRNGAIATPLPPNDLSDQMDVDGTQEADTSFTCTPVVTLQGHKRSVSSLSISPDGQQLVSSGADGLLKLWSIASGSLIATLDAATTTTAAAAATSASMGEEKGNEVTAAENTHLGISDVAWSKDGRYLVCGGDDCMVRVWDATEVSTVFNDFHEKEKQRSRLLQQHILVSLN